MTFDIKGKDYLLRALESLERVETQREWFSSRGGVVSLFLVFNGSRFVSEATPYVRDYTLGFYFVSIVRVSETRPKVGEMIGSIGFIGE